MAILNVYLDIDEEYVNLIKDIYKVLIILVVFQILVSFSTQKNIINNIFYIFIIIIFSIYLL